MAWVLAAIFAAENVLVTVLLSSPGTGSSGYVFLAWQVAVGFTLGRAVGAMPDNR